jgi:hypothetical protein
MTQQMTTPFVPLFLSRSDGKTEIVNKGIKIKNAPSAQQLDRTPNEAGVSDYYRELDSTEPKHQDWRKKLGGMLLRELGGPIGSLRPLPAPCVWLKANEIRQSNNVNSVRAARELQTV